MKMKGYENPKINTYNVEQLNEIIGPVHAQSGTLDVQVGAVAYNNPSEVKYFNAQQNYRIVQFEDNQTELV